MNSTTQHYDNHLAPIYEWMVGGAEAAITAGASDLEGLLEGQEGCVDLGAGLGAHAIPMARSGCQVIAIDSSACLLSRLKELAGDLPVRTVQADLLSFPSHIPSGEKVSLILCMGDTLMHLHSSEDVDRLAILTSEALAPNGRFVATFRDYSRPPQGDQRFIHVRSDDSRILTCFLEELPDLVRVYDILHERTGNGWAMRVSSYLKLRLAPEVIRSTFENAGFTARIGPAPRGMVRLVAQKKACRE